MVPGARVYEDFEPTTEWVSEPKADVLLIHVPGFRKEQLRIQLSASRVLKITGARLLRDNRWQRFHKEVRVPSNCDTKEISAKFEGEILYIRQPKLIIPDEQQQQQQKDQQPKLAAPAEPLQAITQPQPQPQPQPVPPQKMQDEVNEGFGQEKEQEAKEKKEEVEKKGTGEVSQEQRKKNELMARKEVVGGGLFKNLKKPENRWKLTEYVMLALALGLYVFYVKNYACKTDGKHDLYPM